MRRIKILVLIVTLLFGIAGCQKKESEILLLEPTEPTVADEGVKESTESPETTESIFVYVCGAVNIEGVYELPSGSRVYKAIEVAGGFREDADTKAVNQAQIMEDEERIYIPVIGEKVQSESEGNGKIDINRASKEELMSLPGVGESRADSIIKYREDVGAFQSIEDIMQVSGIKEGLFEKIKNLITV